MEPSIRTLHAYLRELANREPDKKILGGGKNWLSAKEVLSSVEAIASKLVQQGLHSGDLVGLRSYRTADTILIILGLQAIGAVAVLTDPRQTVEVFLQNCAVDIPLTAVIDRDLLTVKRTGKQTYITPASLPGHDFPEKSVDPKAPGFIIFTSGSTGKSKAVVLSQYNMINNLLDAQPLCDYRQDDIALGALPLDHVFGLVLLCGVLVLRYGIYLPDNTDIPSILDAIQREGITRMNGVPSLYLTMADKSADYDLSSLRVGFIGGGPCTPEQFVRIERELGMTIVPAYGMSECVGITSASCLDPLEVRANSVGRFYERNTGKILLDDGTEAAVGQEGEICVDGHARMIGYYGDESPREPLLHTGDLGYLDENGIVRISGRKKDIIIRNGNNLSPLRIEQALLSVPGVEAAVVVGLPDSKAGELPWAMVVCGESVTETILAAAAPLLNRNELPEGIFRVPTLPQTASGKPDKQQIREMLKQWTKA